MRYDFLLAVLMFSIASIMLGGGIYLFCRKERIIGLRLIGVLAILNVLNLIGVGAYILADTENSMIIFTKIRYLAVPYFSVLWFLLSLQQKKEVKSFSKQFVLLLLVIPVIMTIGVLLMNISFIEPLGWLSKLVFSSHEVVESPFFGEGFYAIRFQKGIMYYIGIGYNLLLVVLSLLNYKKALKENEILSKKSVLALCVATLFGFFIYITAFLSRNTLLIDYSSLYIVVISLIGFFGLFHYELYDLIPNAYKLVYIHSENPIIILDKNYQVISFNPASIKHFESYFEIQKSMFLSDLEKDVATFFSDLVREKGIEVCNEIGQFFQVTLQTIIGTFGRVRGYLLNYLDITKHKNELVRIQEIASYDELTRIYNRRHFFKLATEAFDEFVLDKVPVGFIMFDLDDFKEINDIYGHQTGDYVLAEMARLIELRLAETDIFARYGGEEFIIFRTHSKLTDTFFLAEELCVLLKKATFSFQNRKIKITASFGVSGTDDNIQHSFEGYIKLADEGLYKAKKNGKNQVSKN